MSSFAHKRTRKRVQAVKAKARPELNDCGWEPYRLAESNSLNFNINSSPDTIQRVDCSTLTLEEFRERYEKPGIPVILTNVTKNWAANEKWTIPRLYKKYRNQKFKCGEDDEGYSVKMKMKFYIDYMLNTTDDSPLYIFDSSFGDRNKTNKLLEDYKVPPMFEDDLFGYASEKRRPPYRWMVIGPARSGTNIHIDPLGTSAWNALIFGHKKWCLIHPSAPKTLIKPRKDESGRHPDEAVTWFSTVYNRVISPSWYSEYPAVHAVQRPGEVMFVPSQWWHVVMNLDNTVAVTQNFCSLANLHQVWPRTVKGRPRFSMHWLRALQKQRPEVVDMIADISKNTDWHQIAQDESSDSSSSSSSSDESDDDSDDSGADAGRNIPITSRKRKLSLRLENLDNRQTTSVNGTSNRVSQKNDSCPNKLRKSP
ncbi:JmjC domain-containing protein [Aphelenchoides bicaudatus]|nr:JmjC domain-containing protein [Aphelenchoides bicaudatus]